jgi:hypothetical protein
VHSPPPLNSRNKITYSMSLSWSHPTDRKGTRGIAWYQNNAYHTLVNTESYFSSPVTETDAIKWDGLRQGGAGNFYRLRVQVTTENGQTVFASDEKDSDN